MKRQSRALTFVLYRIFYGPMLYVRVVYRQLLILLALFIFGALTFIYFEGLSPLIALLASVSTITTIGLYTPNGGNFSTMNRTEALLLITIIIVSVGAGASVVQSMFSSTISGTVRERAEEKIISKLKRHIIIYGYNHMGKFVADKLDEKGYDYVVISSKPEVCDQLVKKNVFAVLETTTDRIGALKSAGIDTASKIIATDANDANNLRFILTARGLRPDIRIHTVVNDPSLEQTAKSAGASIVIPASVAVGELLAFSAETEESVGVLFWKKVGVRTFTEFVISESSPLIGEKLQVVAKLATVTGVLRDGKVDGSVFDGGFTLKRDDTLLVLGETSNLKRFGRRTA